MRNCVIWLVLAEHMQMHLAARARMKNCWTCGTTCFSCVHSQGTHGARDLVQPSAAFWRLRTTCYPLYPSLSLMAEATNWDRGQRLVIHTGTPLGLVMTRLELAVGSIWILHHLGTSRNLGFDPWSELKPVMKSLRHVVTVMRCHEHHIFRVPHWHQVVSLSFSNAWRSGSFTMCMHIYAAMHIPSHSRPFYKSTSIAHRLSLPIWASILGRLAPCCVSTNLTIFNLLFLDEITRTVSAAFQTC